tara:strand:+ start:275 stop:490 length:216 start_codon:yes stop_codon:yes gene_type:complete
MTTDTTDATEPAHLTIQDLADRSQVHTTTVRRWLRDDKAPAHWRIGRVIRFRLADVERWEAALSDGEICRG